MKTQKPKTGTISPSRKPVIIDNTKDKLNWSFSFKYFKQIKHFGLGETSTKWFVSLLEKLSDLSKEKIDDFFKVHQTKEANRYHKIDWGATNIPITRNNLHWIDKNIIENEEDYPFFQFQISKGLGRIVGFWEENYRFFNIVLLDSKHNLQPSKNYNFKIDETTIEHCELTTLLLAIDKLKGLKCLHDGCKFKEELCNLPLKVDRGKLVCFLLEEEYYQEFIDKTKAKSIKDLIELGLLS